MYNEQGVQAISQRSESFKGVIGGKYDCLALSAHDRSRPIDILYVGESIIDCISHYQLHHEKSPRNLVYLSSEGTLTEGQMNLLQVILERNYIREIRTILIMTGRGISTRYGCTTVSSTVGKMWKVSVKKR